MLAVILVVVLIAGAGFWYRSYFVAQKERERQVVSQKAQRARVNAFRNLMESRTAFLVLNAQVDGVLVQIKSKISANVADQKRWDEEWTGLQLSYSSQVEAAKAHNDAETAKYKEDPRYTNRDYWSYPVYPSPPPPITVEFGTETNALTAQGAALEEFIKGLKKSSGTYKDDVINPMYRDLLDAAEATLSAVERDINVLGGIVISGSQGAIVNEARVDLLEYGAGDDSLKALAKKALAFIEEADLDEADYEVPGGADTNPSDKSNLQ